MDLVFLTRAKKGAIPKGFSAEEALKSFTSDLRAIFENTSQGFILTDTKGIVKSFNNKSRDAISWNIEKAIKVGEKFRYLTFNQRLHDSMKQIYGLDIKPGDHIYDFLEKLNPKEARGWKDVYSKALGGEIVKFERELNYNNSHIYFDFSIHPIWKDKNVIGLSCFARNITQQKQAEVVQRQSELHYRQIVETAQEGIWLIDENDRTSFVNQKLCEILEYSKEEMVGKDFFYFIDDADKQRAKSMKRRKGGMVKNIDFRFITKSGRYIWTNITANRIFDNEGNYKSALVMVSDITEKKILRQQLLEGR